MSLASPHHEEFFWLGIPPYFPHMKKIESPCVGAPDQLGYISLVVGLGVVVENVSTSRPQRCLLSKYQDTL